MKLADKPIYALDMETDPFEFGLEVKPFSCGLWTGSIGKGYYQTWGNNCVPEMKKILDELPPGIVYAHNGGKFDLYFCLKDNWVVMYNTELDGHQKSFLTITNGRIIKAYIWGVGTEVRHEFRDSMAIMPFALKKYKKDVIDYRTFTKAERSKNKKPIQAYQKSDCKYLHELCVSFRERFGDNLTIGSTAMKQLKKLHKFDTLERTIDLSLRARYFYGGRVQCFENGIIEPSQGEEIIYYDLNQCYPSVMRNMMHPVSVPDTRVGNEITNRTYFVTVYGTNHNAFPMRTKNGLTFASERGIYSVSIHEYNAAVECGMFECEDIIECVNFERAITFDKFVDKFHKLRKEAQLNSDDMGKEFYKYICNSAFGKFAQNPENYFNYWMTDCNTDIRNLGYYMDTIDKDNNIVLWKKPAPNSNRYNVATGASITGGARSLLIRAIAKAKRPLYCDTDSLTCESLSGVPIDEVTLGAWKIECKGNMMAIAGRKTYAIFDGKKCVKMASKGAVLTPEQIVSIAQGGEVTWDKPSPIFDMKKQRTKFLSRTIRKTV